eukprot:769100-Pelagomonas_calceolata.AAC.1
MDFDPVDLSHFVADLRFRHLGYLNQFTAPDPKLNNSKRLTYHQWCALPVKNAHAIHLTYTMLFGPIVILRSVISVILMTYNLKMKSMCCSDVPIPRSALSVE